MTSDQAVERQASHECLQQELIQALESLVAVATDSLDYRPEFRFAISRAHSTIVRAKEQQS
ncbi:hypothetical protein E5S69_20740 [Cupriavidus necator]|uniref:hypothetical protein n=1 Tax=Cupriavidus necator TaxID=106590 RepID=UPI00148FD6EA|nr:hypothetical protein [Cupriavidus necator]NOV25933.1 hypothetical protein [Cupriavidus necator]